MKKKKYSRQRGRPPKFNSPEEFSTKANQYFDHCHKKRTNLTITGLCLWLDTTRDVLCDYEEKEDFSHAVKMAKMRVEHSYELALYGPNAGGAIFALKNHGWSDKQDVQHSGGQTIRIIHEDEPLGNVNAK